MDLSWITDELAIGGRFPCERAAELARDHRVGAVVDLRAEECDDLESLGDHGIAFLHLPTLDHAPITPAMLRHGVAFALEHIAVGRRVLVHCQYGIGRSALLALCVLVERGYAPLEALALAKDRRERVCPNPLQYQAWAAWLRERKVVPPPFDAFAAIAYRGLI